MNAITPLARGAFSLYQSDDDTETVLALVIAVTVLVSLYVSVTGSVDHTVFKRGVGQKGGQRDT